MLLAESEASGSLNMNMVYRQWAALHGGVYVPITDEMHPNPYLAHIPHRDITTTDGQNLTLINPAYMTRQVHELAKERYGFKGRIVSQKPLRPKNYPDSWENSALQKFSSGLKQLSSVEMIDGQAYLRFMRPFFTEASCLKCHGHQGYKVGDIRGGISVSIPLLAYRKASEHHRLLLGLAHLLIGLLGLAGLWKGGKLLAESQTQLWENMEKLCESEQRFRQIYENMSTGVAQISLDLIIEHVNEACCRMFGYEEKELLGKHIEDISKNGIEEQQIIKLICRGETEHYRLEKEFHHKNGHTVYGIQDANLIRDSSGKPIYLLISILDITKRKKAESEREKLKEQLVQAQKMESVGRLAGGVAHDYNNMLSVIDGYAELSLEKEGLDKFLSDNLLEIRKAAGRSAQITRQLLAFARKQTITPLILNLNDTVESMLKMLRRLIGEDIDLSWHPGDNLGMVKLDPAQIDQLLANLCVNARDAISGVGKITVETNNVRIDEEYCINHAGFFPGDYVVLTVSDNGCGMSSEIMENIFDPFFTTKGMGEGTGLGLPTVYGIVKQNNGFINIYSEPGKGSTFKIYLQKYTGESKDSQYAEPDEKTPLGCGQTILVVEDELSIRQMCQLMLEKLGYRVLSANGPENAIKLADEYKDNICLLLTDVIMPEMNGRELSSRLQKIHPGLKTLFMSGYTANVIAHHGVLDEGVNFIQKPFSRHELAVKINKTIEA